VDLVMDSHWLVASVDVGPFNRTILVDTLSINQTLLSNPLWDSSSPSIANGRVAFLEVTRDDHVTQPFISERNNDVYVFDLQTGEKIQITNDEDIDQFQPQILYEGLAWIEQGEDGESEVLLHSFGEPIEASSSLLLQASVLVLLPLIFVWAHQAATRKEE